MKKLKHISLLICCIFLYLFPCFSQISFANPDLNNEDGLLFSVTAENQRMNWKDLYVSTLKVEEKQASATEPVLLTCFPEDLEVLREGKNLLIRNKNGIFMYDAEKKALNTISKNTPLYPSPENVAKERDSLAALSVSPNGNWMCYFKKTSAATGSLILADLKTGSEKILSKEAKYSFDKIPVLWSPDSNYVLYEKNDSIYFLNTSSSSTTIVDEEFRCIGQGSINAVYWASKSKLVYISHDLVYIFSSNELYTRSLYTDIVGNGKVAGRLPTPFTNNQDRFWTDETGQNIVLLQNNRTLWYMELKGTNFSYVSTLFSYPFVTVPGTAINFSVFWTPSLYGVQKPIVWLELLRSGNTESYVYCLEKPKEGINAYFQAMPLPTSVSSPKISPDGAKLSFMGDTALHVYDINKWQQTAVYLDEKIMDFAWVNKDVLYVGGKETIREWNSLKNTKNVITLSSSVLYGWSGDSSSILASCNAGTFVYIKDRNIWETNSTIINRKAVTQNSYWRVFLDETKDPVYKNGIYVRALGEIVTTKPLIAAFSNTPIVKPAVSVVFDALDNADGITRILSVLSKYKIKATFFLNGEFIRRFPSGVDEIIDGGHQCGSLFYTTTDFASSSYVIDQSYIQRGLARNEDEFYSLTGKELSLIWHAPYYRSSKTITTASAKAGYTLVEPTIKPLDTLSIENAAKGGTIYLSSGKMVEGITAALKPGAVIPVSTGINLGTRTDYLYEDLDLLLSAILEAGYEIVPVTELYRWK
jgi:peptidoglycan/xylan/chitin deacetylase (PgdA/CDA1 family)